MENTSPARLIPLAGALVLILVSLALFLMSASVDGRITHAVESREHAYRLADVLRQSSDDLTRMARTYAVTGDERYRRYFQDILDIRNGAAPRPNDYHVVYWDLVTADGERPRDAGPPVSLDALMQEADFTPAEFELLAKSERESNGLVALENKAFAAVRDGDGETARALLHSDEYHQGKKRIMTPLAGFFKAIDARTATEIATLQAQRRRLSTFLLVTISLSGALAAVALVQPFLPRRRSPG